MYFDVFALTLHHILYIYIMTQQFEIIAKTFMGLEPVLAKELTQLGADDVQIGRRMVSFKGDKELLYRANFQLHTAIRILKPIKHFKALSADDVYEGVKDIDWTEYIGLESLELLVETALLSFVYRALVEHPLTPPHITDEISSFNAKLTVGFVLST